MAKINNYIIIRTLHPLKTRVMYLDVCMQNQYLGDKFLIEEGVEVDYSKEEFRNDWSDVVMVVG